MPRPENTIARSDKMHLWDVAIEDDLVKNALSEITEILEKNLNVADSALRIYDEYLFILKEKQRIEAFLNGNSLNRDKLVEEIKKIEET